MRSCPDPQRMSCAPGPGYPVRIERGWEKRAGNNEVGFLGAEGSKSRVIRCFVLRATFSLGTGRPYSTGLPMHTRARVPIHMESGPSCRASNWRRRMVICRKLVEDHPSPHATMVQLVGRTVGCECEPLRRFAVTSPMAQR